MKSLLKKLSEAHGVPGSEGEVRDIMAKELEKYCDIEIDRLGNLIARKEGNDEKVMLAAHMDEIGLMVKHIDEKGFVRFTTLGGFFDQTILNQRVLIHTGKKRIHGVIGSKPPHLMEEKERKKVVEYKDMFIDVGAKDEKATKKMGIRVGDYITFDRTFRELGGDLVTGKAFDDRLGCLALVEVMKRTDSKCTVYGVGTTQEEVGLKGARTSAFKIDPDMAIVLDVTAAGDFPGVKVEESPIKLGEGPAITIADAKGRGLITHPKVKDLLLKTAEKKKIPYQLEVGEGGTTDASAIHLTRGGVPSGVVSVPTRYIHSPVEVANMKDIENMVKLVTLSLGNIS
ncbi:MAG: M42 family metallopeptidase [Candidatus Hydrothermarchaeales archaeon]